jgi:hypothetical protein
MESRHIYGVGVYSKGDIYAGLTQDRSPRQVRAGKLRLGSVVRRRPDRDQRDQRVVRFHQLEQADVGKTVDRMTQHSHGP